MLWYWLILVFIAGAAVGSFLNVCAARLPYEKSILWPGSHCFNCYQPVRWYDNVPLISYWLLRGRCRSCGAPFSVRYFLVELFTALAFTGTFYVEIILNLLDIPFLARHRADIAAGAIPWQAWMIFGYHAVLLSFLIVASLCDLEDMEIPLSVTVTGTVVGLIGSALFAWPFPNDATNLPRGPWHFPAAPELPLGLYPWPVWYPLPDWLRPGGWLLGLTTGLAGALAPMVVLRGVSFLFRLGRGKEGLGLGDADLMMMAGSFLGWQPTLTAFFVAVFPALFIGILQVLKRKGDEHFPFGPSLAVGVMLTLWGWSAIGEQLRLLFFDPVILAVLVGGGAIMLLAISFLLRLIRGGEPADKVGVS